MHDLAPDGSPGGSLAQGQQRTAWDSARFTRGNWHRGPSGSVSAPAPPGRGQSSPAARRRRLPAGSAVTWSPRWNRTFNEPSMTPSSGARSSSSTQPQTLASSVGLCWAKCSRPTTRRSSRSPTAGTHRAAATISRWHLTGLQDLARNEAFGFAPSTPCHRIEPRGASGMSPAYVVVSRHDRPQLRF
jgi:hypothetical protein